MYGDLLYIISSTVITHFFCFKFATLFIAAKSLILFRSRVVLNNTHSVAHTMP